uniref:sensor histidine kinase n=1 Tax=uncultured Erythrobacter sp. TaxID=263913 RepID=UPI0026119B04|nr:ATP-binding protein [uncultured Erythrobacter sp.]
MAIDALRVMMVAKVMELIGKLHPAYRLLAAFLALQAGFWLLFYPNFVTYRADPVAFIEIESVEFAPVSAPTAQALETANFVEESLAPKALPAGLYAAKATFQLDAVPEAGLAILDIARVDNKSHFANGQLVSSRGSMALTEPTYRGNLVQIGQIPPAMLREGTNTVSIIALVASDREVFIAPPMLGDYADTTAKQSWNEFLQSDFRVITAALTLTLALLVGAVAARSSERRIALWLFALLATWGIYTTIPILSTFPGGPWARSWSFAVSYLFLSICWPCFIDSWTRKAWRYFQPFLIGLFLILAAFLGYEMLLSQTASSFAVGETVMNYAGTALVAVTVIRLLWHFITNPREERIWEGALLLMLLFLSGMFLFDVISDGTNIGYLQKSQPIILLALATAFFAGRFHLFRSAQQISALLQQKLYVREAELAEAHARETLLVREQAFGEERQRIMRDMHDGMGSQLMGMLLAARRGKAEPAKIAEGLQQVIDELRLMIDSMDSVGDSLGVALTGFRTRLQPRVEDAGFEFSWENRIADTLPTFAPRKTLQLFRIIQEAVTNALRHSGGDKIAIKIDCASSDNAMLEIEIRDNGSGIAGPRLGGHGLENMQARAQRENGEVEFVDPATAQGGVVRVRFPKDGE